MYNKILFIYNYNSFYLFIKSIILLACQKKKLFSSKEKPLALFISQLNTLISYSIESNSYNSLGHIILLTEINNIICFYDIKNLLQIKTLCI